MTTKLTDRWAWLRERKIEIKRKTVNAIIIICTVHHIFVAVFCLSKQKQSKPCWESWINTYTEGVRWKRD